jgi:hypothetical protein
MNIMVSKDSDEITLDTWLNVVKVDPMSPTHCSTKKDHRSGLKKNDNTISGIVNGNTGLDVSHPLYLRDKRINIAELCT